MNIGVVGLGYVGLPLAFSFAKKYNVIGFDINESKIENYKKGKDTTKEIGSELVNSKIVFTSNQQDILKMDFIIIAVPTPVDKNNKPDFNPLKEASKLVGKNLKKGTIVVYESTVYPGATEEVCIPLLEKYSNMICGVDFKVGYSPERINPGDKEHKLENIVKVVSAVDEDTLEVISNIYGEIIKAGIHKVSSIRVAEASKIIENTQRDINIAFMNEIAMLFKKMNIDTDEVLEASNTKWNFLNFKQGLVGGHCIGVDPYYLIEKANDIGFDTRLIKTARQINEYMPKYVVNEIENALNILNIRITEARVAVMGITFKENVPDTRNSKAIEIIHLLKEKGISVLASDPIANDGEYNLKKLDEIRDADILIFAVPHKEYKELSAKDIKAMLRKNRHIIFDLKNIYSKEKLETENLIKISL